MLDNGQNNGSLYLGVRDAACRMGVVDLAAATAAFDDLMEMGFIEMTHDAHFHVKASEKSRARCWRLTWLSGPGRKSPTWDFEKRQPEPRSRAYKRMERGLRTLKTYRRARDSGKLPVLDFDTFLSNSTELGIDPVRDSHTLKREFDSISANHDVLHSTTHIAAPSGNERPH